jgi:CMP-N-acetylneuraminic acid synthetase
MDEDREAVGVVAVSQPSFNPRVVCVEEKNGYLDFAFSANSYERRQDAEPVLRINGMLYVWRRDHLMRSNVHELYRAPHRCLVVAEERALDIDSLHDFRLAEAVLQAGIVRLPWYDGVHPTALRQS